MLLRNVDHNRTCIVEMPVFIGESAHQFGIHYSVTVFTVLTVRCGGCLSRDNKFCHGCRRGGVNVCFVLSVEAYAVSCFVGFECVCVCVYKADGWFDSVVAVFFCFVFGHCVK